MALATCRDCGNAYNVLLLSPASEQHGVCPECREEEGG